ncbi:MAG: uroporphyrinogen-III synthase [Acidobacteriota bacterium]
MSRALDGLTILVTRTRRQAGSFSEILRSKGARVLEIPTIEIVPLDPGPLDTALEHLSGYDWLFFTSVNAVEIFFRRYRALPATSPLPRICCIGPATAERVAQSGGSVALQPRLYQAEGIIEEFSALHAGSLEGLRILLPRARVAREILPLQLRERGAEVDLIPVYETVPPPESRAELERILAGSPPDLVTFTSSSTVRNFVELAGGRDDLHELRCAVIGPITADEARQAGLEIVCEAAKSTVPDLVDAIVDYARSRAGE